MDIQFENTVAYRMNNRPKISVAIITYNQQDTIAQTLDSILMQKGGFVLEIVVGEDCSTDGTWEICQSYADRYPDVVRLLPNTHNLGIMGNFSRVMRQCSGEFVGMCAGDDYWCDELKLQKQLDFFNSHAECGVVSTSGYKLLVRDNRMVPNAIAPSHPVEDGNVKSFYFSTEYKGGVYATPLSLLIRKEVLDKVDFDEFVRRGFPVEDYPMQAVMSQYTNWGHIPDLTVVYRVYKESATFVTVDHPKYLDYHRGLMDIRRYLNELFPADACFSEDWMREYEFYKEFLLYLHQRDYSKAKKLVGQYQTLIPESEKLQKTRKITVTWLSFMTFALYKNLNQRKDIQRRT